MIRIFALLLNFASLSALAADLSAITNADAANGLKQALTDGSASAVAVIDSRVGGANEGSPTSESRINGVVGDTTRVKLVATEPTRGFIAFVKI